MRITSRQKLILAENEEIREFDLDSDVEKSIPLYRNNFPLLQITWTLKIRSIGFAIFFHSRDISFCPFSSIATAWLITYKTTGLLHGGLANYLQNNCWLQEHVADEALDRVRGRSSRNGKWLSWCWSFRRRSARLPLSGQRSVSAICNWKMYQVYSPFL